MNLVGSPPCSEPKQENTHRDRALLTPLLMLRRHKSPRNSSSEDSSFSRSLNGPSFLCLVALVDPTTEVGCGGLLCEPSEDFSSSSSVD